ncbi:hypothetical protein Vretifemale_14953 [Volvox reticuliferus]|uniref:ABM domain-containing protein n=1 Tax=Volvox reticuliferus TaxID=1737510 RepID=A0A8J4FW63_9CHLO|nr:hypothetical protein Vretifemale_14953 [Volvox reticuliferus]
MLQQGQRIACNPIRTASVVNFGRAIRTRAIGNQYTEMASGGKVYVVLVKGKVKEGQAALFEKCFAPLAQHVTRNEPGCWSYQLSWSDTDPDSFIIFERYVSKEYLEDVHWKSEPFLQFRKDLEENGVEWVTKDVTKYYETGAGFMSR